MLGARISKEGFSVVVIFSDVELDASIDFLIINQASWVAKVWTWGNRLRSGKLRWRRVLPWGNRLHCGRGMNREYDVMSTWHQWLRKEIHFTASISGPISTVSLTWCDACDAFHSYVFAIGGTTGLSLAMGVDMYDPVPKTWTTGVSQIPETGRTHFCAVEVSNVLWLLGGYKYEGKLQSTVRVSQNVFLTVGQIWIWFKH